MATILVLNLPEAGHVNATLPVVTELVRRGERVVYCGTLPFREPIEATGAEYADYGDAAAFAPPAHRGGLYSVMAWEMALAETALPQALAAIERVAPDCLLIDSMCVWGHLAQQVTKHRAATIASVFVPNPDVVTPDDMVRLAYGRAPRAVLLAGIDALNSYIQVSRRIDQRFGTVSPNIVEFFAGRQALNVIFTSREFHVAGEHFGDGYAFVGPSIDGRVEGEPPDLPPGDLPLIYVSMGTIFNDQAAFYRACLEALAARAVRAVMSVGNRMDAASLGPIPPNVHVRAHVPQLAVLQQAAAFVTHGGMNSVSEALWHGVPLVVFPQHGDQHLTAQRVSEAGAGVVMRPPDVSAERIGTLLDGVLADPALRDGARAIGDSFRRAGGPRRAADLLSAFARGPR